MTTTAPARVPEQTDTADDLMRIIDAPPAWGATNRIRYACDGIDDLNLNGYPPSMKAERRWVCWKALPPTSGEARKPRKLVIDPHTGSAGDATDPAKWGTFEESVARCRSDRLTGIGFALGDGWGGIDLDDVAEINEGVCRFTNPLAMRIAKGLDTYLEVSPSGWGVKCVFRVDPAVDPEKKKIPYEYEMRGKVDSVIVETNTHGKFYCLTGHGRGDVQERTQLYQGLLATILRRREPKKPATQPGRQAAVASTADNAQATEDMLRAALAYQDADGQAEWHKVGCALKQWAAEVGEPRARRLYDEWSKRSTSKYDQAEQDRIWDRVSPDGIGIGTLFHEAQEQGWGYGQAVAPDGSEYTVDNMPEWFKRLDAWHAESIAELKSLGIKPVVELPNIGGWSRTTITESADQIGKLMGGSMSAYYRGGVVVNVKDGESVEVSAAEMQSELERHASLVIAKVNAKGDVRTVSTTATASQCQAVMASHAYLDKLPQIKTMTRCPVIAGRKSGGLAVVSGYDRESGILATGGKVETVSLEEAVPLLMGCLADFDFSSRGDQSRAVASLITPALVQGGLLGGRSPIDLGEADDSQAGKGYRNRMVAAVYNSEVNTIAQRQGGSGSLEESFCRALMAGISFLSIDNVRRKIDSPLIESALTEDYCDCRVPYRQPMQIDMRRVCVMMTTNGVELNRDLANRCSPVRIRKRQAGYVYRKYPEGDLIAHVKANQGLFLGAVFAVVKAWHEAGMPATNETRHDFRRWAGVLDWIVQHIFKAAPLCDGLIESKARMTNPHLSWLRELAIAVLRKGMGGKPLRAGSLVDVAEEAGIELGGDPSTASDPDKAANQMMGKKLGRAFALSVDGRTLAVDDTLTVVRQSETDSEGRERKLYTFGQGVVTPQDEVKNGFPPDQGASAGSSGGNRPTDGQPSASWGSDATSHATESVFPPDSPPDSPLINPLIKPNNPLIPLIVDNTFSTIASFSTPEDGGDTTSVVIGEKNALIRGSGGIKWELDGEIDPELDPDWEAKFWAIGEEPVAGGDPVTSGIGQTADDLDAELDAILGLTLRI